MLTIKNLLSVAQRYFDYTYPVFAPATAYTKGQIVTDSGNYYVALQDTQNNPINSTDHWVQTSPFSEWLYYTTKAGILRAIRDWMDTKLLNRVSVGLVESRDVFRATGRIEDTDTVSNDWVGLEITPKRNEFLKTTLSSVKLQFSQDETITLFLFDARRNTAIASQVLTYNTAPSAQYFKLNNFEMSGEGAYYLAYRTSTLNGASINGVRNYTSIDNTSSCFHSRFVSVVPFGVDGPDAELWDISLNKYGEDTNYGLNPTITVECDYTDFILRHAARFDTLIALRVAMDCLRTLNYNANARVNRNETNIDSRQMLYEIDGDSQGRPGGLKHEYEKTLKALDISTEGIDPLCLSCKRRGIKTKTAW